MVTTCPVCLGTLFKQHLYYCHHWKTRILRRGRPCDKCNRKGVIEVKEGENVKGRSGTQTEAVG